ncbi:MAG: undecaprenyldiphospho-muramoylpentapeptide beta-N-acetylglucosaminyltransferase [Acutalibacteraceae bacterium]|jgi:UDP-N-acetylglucosamine--N-acetylmuramyl-(pentapeptide) pyrophosphoryl-undecaprenol N-acetylglucosamine transferase
MRVVFAAGGTGGHINPALAAAGELKRKEPNAEILFIGTADKMEAKLVPAAGFDFKTISISGFQRKLSLQNIKRNIITLRRLVTSGSQVKKILKEFKPDAVIGFGGYVSGPVVRTAAKMGIKTAIHEQNAFPGITNKTLAKYVDTVMTAVPEAADRLKCKNPPVVTGLPVRGAILAANKDFSRAELHIKPDEILIFSTGGSLGAKTINELMLEVISELHTDKKLKFIHGHGQYGHWFPEKLKERGIDLENSPNIDVREYIYNMDVCLSAADIVVSRAGAGSIAEIQALGKAAILIPSPNVAENHQYFNAKALADKDAAILFEESKLDKKQFVEFIKELSADKDRLGEIGRNAKKMAVTDAPERICGEILKLVTK